MRKVIKAHEPRLALANLRWRLGMSRADAALLTGVSGERVRLWELGQGGYRPDGFAALCSHCDALRAIAAERKIRGRFTIEQLAPDLFRN